MRLLRSFFSVLDYLFFKGRKDNDTSTECLLLSVLNILDFFVLAEVIEEGLTLEGDDFTQEQQDCSQALSINQRSRTPET